MHCGTGGILHSSRAVKRIVGAERCLSDFRSFARVYCRRAVRGSMFSGRWGDLSDFRSFPRVCCRRAVWGSMSSGRWGICRISGVLPVYVAGELCGEAVLGSMGGFVGFREFCLCMLPANSAGKHVLGSMGGFVGFREFCPCILPASSAGKHVAD